MSEAEESAAWGTPFQQPLFGSKALHTDILAAAATVDVPLFSPIRSDDVTYCDFNYILKQLTVAESMELLRNYGYVVDWSVEIPAEHAFRFDGVLAYQMYLDGTRLSYNKATSGAWPPSGSVWEGLDNDADDYADLQVSVPSYNGAFNDPRRLEGYNLNRLPITIRAELETAFGATLDTRYTWFRLAGCNEARIAWLTTPVPRTTAGSSTPRRCFAAQPALDGAHDPRIVKRAQFGWGSEGTQVGRTGSVNRGTLTTPANLADQFDAQPADFRAVEDGSYLARRQNTSVTVTITGGAMHEPFEPCFFDADFALDGKLTSWNYDSTDVGNATAFDPSDAYTAPLYRSPYFATVLAGVGTNVSEQPMMQRVHEYWWKTTAPIGYLNVTGPALPVPQWWIGGHEEEMLFDDLARVASGKNAFKDSFTTMQSDLRFAHDVGRFLGFELGASGQADAYDEWRPGGANVGVDCDPRESLWNSFAFRKTGEVLGLVFQAIASAFSEAGGYPLNGFHYRHQYKAGWTYFANASYRIMTSPWDWGDTRATHQAPVAYGNLTQQWNWLRQSGGEVIRPGADIPRSLVDGSTNLMTTAGAETGYTAFAQHYGSVVSAAAASRKPLVVFVDQSIFTNLGVPIPQPGNLHGTLYWNELILHCAMQADRQFPFYWYNTDNVDPDSREYSELTLFNLLEELDAVLGTGQVIPHIPRPSSIRPPTC